MKRSQFHSFLTVALCTYNWPKCEGDQGVSPFDLANFILDEVEKIGMQPPAYFNREYHDEPECDGMLSEWEPE